MLIPPRPLPIGDRLYLRIRYNTAESDLRHFEQLGLTREDIERTLRRQEPLQLRGESGAEPTR